MSYDLETTTRSPSREGRTRNGKEFFVEKELVKYVAQALVDEPNEVEVNMIEGEKSTILELKVASADVGKVIGKHGRIAKAIRTILSAAGTKTGKRVVLEILD